ncbi:heavy-metal-associated domain-containing protein [Peptococcaceae bacterium 1198_IL3148]
MPQETFKVGGLFNQEEKEEIESYLSQVDGVKNVQASLADKSVTIDYDSSVVEMNWLKRTLQSLGHDTNVIN